jgi:hypothetical protein
MSTAPVRLLLRKLATCAIVAVACTLSVPSSATIVEVVEFYDAGLDHYFISADPAEIDVLDGGAFGGAWRRTMSTFPAWDLVGAPADTVPVCRFFGTDKYRADGTRIGPDSHFYDAVASECDFVKTAYQSIAADGLSYPAWTFEKNAFAVKLPVGDVCPTDTQPLYRTYNNGARGNPNHRYSMRADLLQGMVGWTFEGLKMCVPKGQPVALPSPLVACAQQDCDDATPLNTGPELVNLIVEIVNTTATPMELIIPEGQTFVAVDNGNQNGLSVERLQATIAPGTTRKFVLGTFCTNKTRHAAATGAIYSPGPVTANAQLLDIASLADGKISGSFDPGAWKMSAVQFSIWLVTDGNGSLTALQRSLLVQMLATAPDDDAQQAALYQQLFNTLLL